MSKPVNIVDFPHRDSSPTPPPADRRENERQIATFRTCCVMLDGVAHPAILRNMSDGGAMFEALLPVERDTRIIYWWDGIDPVDARVAWVDGNRIGVANLSGPAHRIEVPRPRATRVPARLPVRIWSGSRSRRGEMHDISMSGIAVLGLDDIAPGTLCTIELGGQALHNASVVRTEDGITGIRFERPLPPTRLMELLEGVGPASRVPTDPVAPGKGADPPSAPDGEPDPDPVEGPPANAPIPLRRFL